MSMKNSIDTIGNRTSDLPTCSAVPQPTAPPRAPKLSNVHILNHCWSAAYFEMSILSQGCLLCVIEIQYWTIVNYFLLRWFIEISDVFHCQLKSLESLSVPLSVLHCLVHSFTLMIEAVCSFWLSALAYQTKWHHISDGGHDYRL